MSENFLGALRNNRYLKDARANRKETHVCYLRPSCISHTWPISRPHDLHSQSFVAVTHYILIAPHFTYPGGMEAMSYACLLRGSNPDLLYA